MRFPGRKREGKRKRKMGNESERKRGRDTIKPFLGSIEKSVNRPTFIGIFF